MAFRIFGSRKKKQPLVAGRDRSAGKGSSAPVYSYYASRAVSPSGNQKQTGHPASDRSGLSNGEHRLRIGLHTVVVSVCVLVGLVCFTKLIAVSTDAKVILEGSENAVNQQRITTYTRAANTLLESSILNRTKLTLDSTGIATTMLANFPELTSVEVTAPLVGNRPVVYVSPAEPAFNLQTAQGLYSLDAHGFVLAKIAVPDTNLTLLKETSDRVPVAGKQYLATSIVSFSEAVAYELHKAGGLQVQYIDLPAAKPYEVDVYTEGNPYRIVFNLKEDPQQQSGAALAAISKISEGGGAQPKEYIDVRVPGRAYYK